MIRPILILACLLILAPAAVAQKKTQNFWDRVWKFLGLSATSSNQKGVEDKGKNFDYVGIFDGNIWIYNVQTRGSEQLKEGDFRSPVFLTNEQAILAITGERVVKISLADRSMTDVATVPGIKKLVGVENDTPDNILVLTDLDHDNCPGVGILSLTKHEVTALPNEGREEDLALVNYLSSWKREFSDKTVLELRTKKEENGNREFTDVWLKLKDKNAVNVSRCERVNCGQPSISNDRSSVVFVQGK